MKYRRHSMRRYQRSMRRRWRSIWRHLRLGQRRQRSRGGHSMRRYRRWMRRRRRSMRRRRRSARRCRRSRGVYSDIGVGITPQMCNRVTNHGDMSTFSKPARRDRRYRRERDPMLNSVLNGDWSNSVPGRKISEGMTY